VKAAVPDAFYIFNERLSELLNRELSPETEATALKLFDEIYAELIQVPKQSKSEIIKEVTNWQPQDSGLSNPD
jgi:flagellin-specific chaperone FliS